MADLIQKSDQGTADIAKNSAQPGSFSFIAHKNKRSDISNK